jgi:kumamolisin
MASPQHRVELKTSARAPLRGARLVGPADPNEKMEVTITLRRGSQPAAFPSIDQMGSRLPSQRSHLTREAFASTHGARGEDLAKIRAFASQSGLNIVEESAARRSVVLGGTVQAFSNAFAVELQRYEHPSGNYRGRTGTIQIPAELDGVIEGVFGLDNRPQAMPHFRRHKEAGPGKRAAGTSYSPLDVARAYNFPAGTDGTGQCIAILELGGGYHTQDLQNYFKGLGIPMPKVTAIKVDHGSNKPTNDPNGPDGEVELDIEVAGAIAPAAHICVYFTPNTDQGFLDALTTAIHDSTNKPSIVSISWGGPESSWTQQAMNAFSSACQDGATMGVTVLAASGDNGATDGDQSGQLTVDFPAASPYVLGCGGTKLIITNNTISSEVAWNELASNEGATGGGVSQVFPQPTFQQNAGVPTAPNGFTGRGVPDVAGDADPATGYSVLVDGQASVIGGTSAVAPLWSGLLARINQSLGAPVGYLNPLLYSKGVETTLHDITSGSNGGWSSGPGWDPCTGLGTPDGSAILGALGGKPVSQQRASMPV